MERLRLNEWKIVERGFNPDTITKNGNKFFIGNGYLGIRGTLEEFEKDKLPAINLAGIYDQVGDAWREPLNAPNALFTYIMVDGIRYALPEAASVSHEIILDYRKGIFLRETTFHTKRGQIHIASERLASLASPHIIAMKYKIWADFKGEIILVTGIDADVWDMNGPHYVNFDFTIKDVASIHNILEVVGTTGESLDQVYVAEYSLLDTKYKENIKQTQSSILRYITIDVEKGTDYELEKYISIFTSKDGADAITRCESEVVFSSQIGFEGIKKEHIETFERKWRISEVIIQGDAPAMEALNYSIYHLHCIAPRHSKSLSIAARGLSGQTYKGAVFWDTEMFILDFFLKTEPSVARTLVKYRIETLDGAKRKASSYGYQGAFYAWESQEGGYDACSDYNVTDVFTNRPMRTYFKDKQIHISAAIVYGIMSYVKSTNDWSILQEGGSKVILECAIFYNELLLKRRTKDIYELHDVIGPDEYHERVNNNGYTNRMAKYTFDMALEIISYLEYSDKMLRDEIETQYNIAYLKELFTDASLHIYIPNPKKGTGVIEQFDGYFNLSDVSVAEVKSRLLHPKEYWGGAYGVATHTQVIKQADVVTFLTLFHKDYNKETLWKNWEYYEPRTEHGSSLSACMYALLACKCDEADKAYSYFMKSATSDLNGSGKEWAGLIYIGGTHPAAAGGAYMTAIQGFGGISIENGKIISEPKLPSHWSRLKFSIVHHNELYHIEIQRDKQAGDDGKDKVRARIFKESYI